MCCVVLVTTVKAQQITDSSKIVAPPAAYDITDFFKTVFKKKPKKDTVTLKTTKPIVTVFPIAGYSLQTGLAVALSSVIEFNADTAAEQKISSILTNVTYTQYRQVLFPLAINIWTKHNKYNIVLDYRFLKYPSTTYGLGANTAESDAYSINYRYIKLHQSILKRLSNNLYAGIGFYYDHFWNIAEVDPPAGVTTSFQKYGSARSETASGIALKMLFDSRDNQVNPALGTYANITFRPNYTFLGSDNNWQALQAEYRVYIPVSGRKHNTLALWSYNWLTLGSGKPPYLSLPSTGWDDQYNTGRGYIQSRFRAKQMIYAEAEYRFGISNNGFLGGVAFLNGQSFSRYISGQLATVAPGFGAGLRVKLNKSSNTNLCIDYGFGLSGSKGLFLNLGEVF